MYIRKIALLYDIQGIEDILTCTKLVQTSEIQKNSELILHKLKKMHKIFPAIFLDLANVQLNKGKMYRKKTETIINGTFNFVEKKKYQKCRSLLAKMTQSAHTINTEQCYTIYSENFS